MRKKLVIICLMFFSSISCAINEKNPEKKIYDVCFKNIEIAAVIKMTDTKYLTSTIKGDEIVLIKDQMKIIKNIKKNEVNPFENVKGYHLLYLYPKNSKIESIAVLYSIENRSMMIKENDLYQKGEFRSSKIIVYQFDISEKVASILRKHEQSLLNEGVFLESWPLSG